MKGLSVLPVLPCCAPSKTRAHILDLSRQAAAERERATSGSADGMIKLEGGPFLMGAEDADSVPQDGEGPIRECRVDPFYLDRHTVTNAQFQEFIAATGYITEAERFGWSFVFSAKASNLQHVPGMGWWRRVDGAIWSHPEGPDSSVTNRETHPAVHVSWNDAAAYAKWAGKRLPTETEWEFAARGGLIQKRFPWGDDLTPNGKHLCNIWQGEFPTLNTAEDGYEGTAPIDAFPPNGFGLQVITGNTWEWCSNWFSPDHHLYATRDNPVGPAQGTTRAMRGGSYLCHTSYCNRYRVAARTSNTPDSSTTNISFRCALDIKRSI
jgi:formylglycine-generating enzyme required for sulfatase activity